MVIVGTYIRDTPKDKAHLLIGYVVSLEGAPWTILAIEDAPYSEGEGTYTILLSPNYSKSLAKTFEPHEDHPVHGRVRRIHNKSTSAARCLFLAEPAAPAKDPLVRFLHIR